MLNKQYKVGAVLSYLSMFIGNIIGILYTPIMLRMLGQEEYGLYSLVGSMIAILNLVDLGFGNACIRYISKYRALGNKEKEYSVSGMFLLINTAISIFAVIFGLIFHQVSDELFNHSLSPEELEKFNLMFLILVFNLAISFPFSVFGSIIVSYEMFIFPKVIGIIRTLINPIVILTVLYMGYDSLGMVIANTVLNVLFLWVNVYYCFKKLHIKLYFKNFDFKLLKEISVYSFFIFIAIIVDKIYWTTDQFILGIYSGTVAVSIYAIASQINMYYMQFSTAISGMFLPKVTALVTKETDEKALTDLFIKIGRIQYVILGLILSGLILFGKEFIVLWAGSEYRDAYLIALILVVPFTIPLIQNIGLSILQAKNMHKFRSVVLIFIALGNLIISIPLAQKFGGIGSASGTAISMIIGNILVMNIYYYKKIKINIPKFWMEITKMSIPIGLCLGLGIIIDKIGYGIIPLILKICIYTVIYSLLMYHIGMTRFEKELFVSPVKGLMNKVRGNYKASKVNG
ncbi:oligosaccharide flippase family protein [Mesobacillus foraminis]|uniref:oligosaccharide flippase family protein n=1 Tax=Mesobacillus foraminis TaxID=279826 RepID=UPI000EF4FEF3|nr:oligosaccharide flippase family protein [Mesobacillus foraminis]